jgi:uncharacterized protein
MRFVGRGEEFAWLDRQLDRVGAEQGRLLGLRGRRQVGKSRLLTEWLRGKGYPTLYYQALERPVALELASFTEAVSRSSLRTLPTIAGTGATWPNWQAAFEALAVAAGAGEGWQGPTVVVLDEFPYLVAQDPSIEATLQAAWDHRLQHTGILLVLVGSDLAMMEALSTYGRPLYQRIDAQLQVDPLNVADVGALLGVDTTTAIDTYLMTGGFPKVVAERIEHASSREFLRAAVEDEAHPLVFTGQQTLLAEFPPQLAARSVLEAIGAGERTFGSIQTRAGVSERTLAMALRQLASKRVITAEDPRSARPLSGRTRYAVADPYLRFWLRFLGDRIDDIARGRGDLVAADIDRSWQDYAGTAVEPLVRDAIERLLPDEDRFGRTRYVGGYWTRRHEVQVDLVGTADEGKSPRVELVGSIKWRARKRFGPGELSQLESLAAQVPGVEPSTLRVGVSRTGFTPELELPVALAPDDLVAAWRR